MSGGQKDSVLIAMNPRLELPFSFKICTEKSPLTFLPVSSTISVVFKIYLLTFLLVMEHVFLFLVQSRNFLLDADIVKVTLLLVWILIFFFFLSSCKKWYAGKLVGLVILTLILKFL